MLILKYFGKINKRYNILNYIYKVLNKNILSLNIEGRKTSYESQLKEKEQKFCYFYLSNTHLTGVKLKLIITNNYFKVNIKRNCLLEIIFGYKY